jgi:4-hydroxybenzoate polyprenyltransferase
VKKLKNTYRNAYPMNNRVSTGNRIGGIQRFQAYMDLGRAQGITTTASVAICGALSSTAPLQWYHIIYFTIISALLHAVLNIYIALGDIELDAQTYVPTRNPVTDGRLSQKDALTAVYTGSAAGFIAILPFFLVPQYPIYFVLPTVICVGLAYFWLIWYGYKGKKVLFSYDFAFSVSYAFWVLFGVFAIGGMPTIYTWLFIGVVVTAATAFAQWENGLKDVDADRAVGVQSFAVRLGVRANNRLHLTHPYFIYGVGLKTGFILCCILAYLMSMNTYYLLFVLFYGVPTQTYIMWRFMTLSKPIEHRKTILLDVPLSAMLAFSVIATKTGAIPVAMLMLYLIGGYFIGSMLQSECEFKFGRFKLAKDATLPR